MAMALYKSALRMLIMSIGFSIACLPAFSQAVISVEGQVPTCASLPNSSDAQEIVGRAPNRFLGDVVKQNSPDYWQPIDGRERALCLVEMFSIEEQKVVISHAGFLKGVQTLLYQVEVSGARTRQFQALYSPSLDFMSGEHLAFTLVEATGEQLNVFAMYHSEPSYRQVRVFVEAIIREQVNPVLTAKWQEGAGNPVLTIDGLE